MSIINALVVDDVVAVCRILHRTLSKEYKVQTSYSVADALGAIEKKPFDVYLIDYKLPDGSGFDVGGRDSVEIGSSSNHLYLVLSPKCRRVESGEAWYICFPREALFAGDKL
jgi:response regulator RpfG family c-di-GMP phosphodiesterase